MQQIVGTILYYARVIDPNMLVALSTISQTQHKGTQNTWKAVQHLLDYCHTFPHAIL